MGVKAKVRAQIGRHEYLVREVGQGDECRSIPLEWHILCCSIDAGLCCLLG